MSGEVITVYADEQPPEYWDASVFLAGTITPLCTPAATSWQAEAIVFLREQWAGTGRLVLFVPEFSSGTRDDGPGQMVGGQDRIHLADVVMFWSPDNADIQQTLMNIAWGARNGSERAVPGTPSNTPEGGRLFHCADIHAVSAATTLRGAVSAALDKIGRGARRSRGECDVPLPVWQTDSFQRWYGSQAAAGNTLLGARLVWAFSVEPDNRFLLYWALRVRMNVKAEGRVKSNEVVISRPDISVVALYQRGTTVDDTLVVLIREFRSPASTPDGFVHELPGGSGPAHIAALEQAVSEATEETGLAVDIQRMRAHGSRQLTATLSAHHAHLFSAEITDAELAYLRAAQSRPHGIGHTEQTWTEITTFAEIRRKRLVDWATLGMIAEVILTAIPRPLP